jgi:BirA family biotin operon repressor/biotin-[acetyl-CoA-carboxylase] ligase
MNEHSLRAALAHLNLPAVYYLETVGSTNDYAQQLAESGAADGTLVVAEEQTRGRGRLDRRWLTPAGSALAFSLVLRPTPGEIERLGLFAPLCGVAVCAALRRGYGLVAEVKWPNDVLLDQRKACGVLVEAHWLGVELQCVIAGIGLNVAPASVPPPGEVLFPAACVEEQIGHRVEREGLLAAVLEAFWRQRPTVGSPAFLATWESWLAFKGQPVQVESAAGVLNGRVLGVAADGSLRLQSASGAELAVSVGDVRLRPAAS